MLIVDIHTYIFEIETSWYKKTVLGHYKCELFIKQ